MYLLAEALLAGVLLAGVLPHGVLLEREMVLAMSVFLEKREKILPELEIPEEEKALLLFGALLALWCSWHPFSSANWTGGHRHFCFWLLPIRQSVDTKRRICEYQCSRCKSKIGMSEKV